MSYTPARNPPSCTTANDRDVYKDESASRTGYPQLSLKKRATKAPVYVYRSFESSHKPVFSQVTLNAEEGGTSQRLHFQKLCLDKGLEQTFGAAIVGNDTILNMRRALVNLGKVPGST